MPQIAKQCFQIPEPAMTSILEHVGCLLKEALSALCNLLQILQNDSYV